MARPAVGSAYGRVLFDNQGALATWLPDRLLRVGDIISRAPRTGILTVETTFTELLGGFGHPTTTRRGPKTLSLHQGATFDYTTGTELRGAAAATLTFAAESSFIFAGRDGSSEYYQHLDPIRSALLELADRGVWRGEWQLVTSVQRFAACTIVIARQRGTTAHLSLDTATSLAGTDVLAATAGVSITSGDASTWELRSARPFYGALEVTRNFWTGRPAVSSGTFGPGLHGRDEFDVVQAEPTELDLPLAGVFDITDETHQRSGVGRPHTDAAS